MAITATGFHTFRVLSQIERALTNTQLGIRRNAQVWKLMTTRDVPAEQIAIYMADAAQEWQRHLANVATYRNTNQNWSKVSAMLTALGVDPAELVSMYQELKTVVDQLAATSPKTYTAINNICDQLIAAVQAPDSIWAE